MHEIEDLLRSSLQRNAEDVTPRSEAIQEAVSTVQGSGKVVSQQVRAHVMARSGL